MVAFNFLTKKISGRFSERAGIPFPLKAHLDKEDFHCLKEVCRWKGRESKRVASGNLRLRQLSAKGRRLCYRTQQATVRYPWSTQSAGWLLAFAAIDNQQYKRRKRKHQLKRFVNGNQKFSAPFIRDYQSPST